MRDGYPWRLNSRSGCHADPVISVETLLVAIIGGLGGGVIGTWLQIRHERREAFRERLIAAADALSTSLLQASLGVAEARTACVKHGFLGPDNQVRLFDEDGKMIEEIKSALTRADELIAEAQASIGRVSLFFGTVSPTERSATQTISELKWVMTSLREWPNPNWAEVSKGRSQATKHLQEFNDRALREIQGERRWRSWRRRDDGDPSGETKGPSGEPNA